MTTSLSVSGKLDRLSTELLLAANAVAAEAGITYCIVGAFARDVVLGHCFGINTGEATRDIDLGLMMNDWSQFEDFRSRLLSNNEFTLTTGIPHRLKFKAARELDIVPFGRIESRPGEIAWPPDFSTVMSTVGLREAHAHALHVAVTDHVVVPFVSPAALAMLKLIAWSGRGTVGSRKDARDLSLILTTYLRAGNEARLYKENAELLREPDFDLERAGARLLGRDVARIADDTTLECLAQILDVGLDPAKSEQLARALPLQFERARLLLESLSRGIGERSRT
jgi:predicted nucleotidyltransferase